MNMLLGMTLLLTTIWVSNHHEHYVTRNKATSTSALDAAAVPRNAQRQGQPVLSHARGILRGGPGALLQHHPPPSNLCSSAKTCTHTQGTGTLRTSCVSIDCLTLGRSVTALPTLAQRSGMIEPPPAASSHAAACPWDARSKAGALAVGCSERVAGSRGCCCSR